MTNKYREKPRSLVFHSRAFREKCLEEYKTGRFRSKSEAAREFGLSPSTFESWVKKAGIRVDYDAKLSEEEDRQAEEPIFEDRTMADSEYVIKDGYGRPVKFKSDKEEMAFLRARDVYRDCLLKELGISEEEIEAAKKKLQQDWPAKRDQAIKESQK